MKMNKKSRVKVAGLSSCFALLAVLGTAVACPMTEMSSVHAADSAALAIDFVLNATSSTVSQTSRKLTIDFFLANGNPNYPAVFQMLGIDFVLRGNIAIQVENLGDVAIEETVQPTNNGTFVSGSTDFSVYTSDTHGFNVYVNSLGDETAMVNTSGDKIAALANKSTGVAVSSFEKNSWGYGVVTKGTQLANVQYRGVTASGTDNAQSFSRGANGSQDLTLVYGAKIGTGVKPGDYSSTVQVTAVTNAETTALRTAAYQLVDAAVEEAFQNNPELKEQVEALKASSEDGDVEDNRENNFETLNAIINLQALEQMEEQE